MPMRWRWRADARVMSPPRNDTEPRGGVAQAGQRLDQLRLAVALDAGDADHLARMDGQVDAVDGNLAAVVEDAQLGHLEQRLARR